MSCPRPIGECTVVVVLSLVGLVATFTDLAALTVALVWVVLPLIGRIVLQEVRRCC